MVFKRFVGFNNFRFLFISFLLSKKDKGYIVTVFQRNWRVNINFHTILYEFFLIETKNSLPLLT